jgi:hypothetical protein
VELATLLCRFGLAIFDLLILPQGRFAHPAVLRKKKSRSLRDLPLQAVFVMQAPEHGRLFDTMTGWQLVPLVADRNAVLGGFRQAWT